MYGEPDGENQYEAEGHTHTHNTPQPTHYPRTHTPTGMWVRRALTGRTSTRLRATHTTPLPPHTHTYRYVCTESLDGENQYEAEGHGKQDAEKGVKFMRFPPVLNIQLKRFDPNPVGVCVGVCACARVSL